ncbi:MAG TPA: hypothetical protein VIL36_18050, partial [Acidimicrobiales bacterium]
PGWVWLGDRLRDPAALDAWYRAELEGPAAGHRDLAGSLIVYRFAGSLAELVMGPRLDQRRVLVLTPDDLALQLAAGTRIDAVAATPSEVVVRADDPDAGRPGTRVVTDDTGLAVAAATSLHAVFAPLAAAVRARAPFGLPGMWGTLADHVAEGALAWARDHGEPPEPAWRAADAVLDHLTAREPRLRVRPRPHPAGRGLYADKGTCCLIYKVHPAATKAEQLAVAACTSCPLRSDADRHARFTRHAASR